MVGVRPEAFHLSDGRTDEPVLAVRVEVVEPLGHESIVYGSIRGERAPAVGTEAGLPPLSSERATIVARLGGKAQPAGEAISLAFSPEDLRLFDGSSGARSRSTAGSRSHPRRIPRTARPRAEARHATGRPAWIHPRETGRQRERERLGPRRERAGLRRHDPARSSPVGVAAIARTHGGAIARGVLYELPLRYKAARYQREKALIAREAASRVGDGRAVGLTGGTTTTEVARMLVERQQLTVVTNALNIASELAVRPNLKLVVTGGVARDTSYELVGPIAEQGLAGLNLDLVFLGADGVDPEAGLTTHHAMEAHTDRALIERAQRVVVVADSSKIGRVAFARICEIERVHEMITDAGADRGPLEQISQEASRSQPSRG